MIPGVDPRQMKAMMRQMGMSQNDIDAQRVIIETSDKRLVFDSPSVQKISMKGDETYQISGSCREEELKIDVVISDEDIKTVSEQAGVSEEEAKKSLENTNGDIAEAIVRLNE